MKQVVYGFGIFVLAFALGAGLARWAAPGQDTAMLLAGAALAFGIVVGYKALEWVALALAPLVLARMALRWAATGSPLRREDRSERDRGLWLARLIFVPVYALYASAVGAAVGVVPGGHGLLLSGLAYGAAGLAFSVPAVAVATRYFD